MHAISPVYTDFSPKSLLVDLNKSEWEFYACSFKVHRVYCVPGDPVSICAEILLSFKFILWDFWFSCHLLTVRQHPEWIQVCMELKEKNQCTQSSSTDQESWKRLYNWLNITWWTLQWNRSLSVLFSLQFHTKAVKMVVFRYCVLLHIFMLLKLFLGGPIISKNINLI